MRASAAASRSLDLELRDKTGLLLLHNANLVAYHRRATPNLWSIAFKADCEFPRIRGAHAVGNFKIGEGGGLPATQMLAGNLRFSHLPLARLTIGNVEVNGQSHGNLELAVAYDASIEGLAALGVEALTVRSPDLSSPVELGNYSLEARFSTSSDQVSISEARLKHQGKSLMAGQGFIRKPYEPNPHLAVGIAGLTIVWKDVLDSIRTLRRIPPELETMIRQVKSGRIEVAKASVDTPLWRWRTCRLNRFCRSSQ